VLPGGLEGAQLVELRDQTADEFERPRVPHELRLEGSEKVALTLRPPEFDEDLL
jgi:hypothetical protein